MCDGQYQPSSVTEALRMLDRTLDFLNAADAASLPSSVQAEALRALERADAKVTAAQARMLAAFAGRSAYEDDGQGSAGAWLRWQTRVTRGAAAGAVGWAHRVAAHPVIGDALAAGELSESWARQICAWTDRLPRAGRAMRMRFWPPPRAAVWTRPGWAVWRRKCTNARTGIATVMARMA